MPKHAAPRTRSPFWTILGATAATAAIVTGTLGWATVPVQGTAHPSTDGQTADAYGCYWLPEPAWVSDRTSDGLCHDGPHGQPYGHDSVHGLVYDAADVDQHAADEAYCDAAAERDYTTGVVDQVADHRCAALLIEDRLQAGGQVFEDFTWEGMPAIVEEQSPRLVAEYQANAEAAPDAADVDEFLGWIADGNDVTEL